MPSLLFYLQSLFKYEYVIFFYQTRANLQILGITASNTWGLLLLVFLMGYGLVEVPRTTWNTARLELQMAHAYFKISKLSVEKEEADEQFSEVLEVARTAASLIILSSKVVCVLSLQKISFSLLCHSDKSSL